jgi:pyrroloquinoline quinone biosynthesis protein E
MAHAIPRPFSLLAELTHRCPLHCPYCSNPTQLASVANELSTADWMRVLNEAAELGALHVGFSGGEPLQRNDLAELVAVARRAGLYSNLITSAVGLTPARARELKAAGLDSVQISFQAEEPLLADKVAGTNAHATKLNAARLVRELGLPLTINVVLHRANIERLPQIVALAEELGAERLELANTQFYGWAFANRAALLPTRAQILRATEEALAAKRRLLGKMEILFVAPDYYGERPKPCMHGWGQRHITVDPVGDVLPCPTARSIRELTFDNVKHKSLRWIWSEADAFTRFRGTEWMPDPCRSCDFREIDFGGCRCQAALLTGDATVTDPACALSPHRATLNAIIDDAQHENGKRPTFEAATFRQNAALATNAPSR